MKKTIITTGIIVVVTLIALIVFNKITSKKGTTGQFTEARSGKFEIVINTTGELLAEKSVDINGPLIASDRDVRATNIRISDIVPEGTEVKAGDYVASLDKTEFANNLRDGQDRLTTMKSNLDMALLDTSLTLNNIRDQINNQVHTVAEMEMTFRNSKYESPPIIRQAEINLEQSRRVLDQLKRSYSLRKAQTARNINNQRLFIGRIERSIRDYEELLAQFDVRAPSAGMVIYKKDRMGRKRIAGSSINTMDRVVATLPDLTTMLSQVYVSEIEVTKVVKGQTVNITVDAFPSKSYSGTVISLANIGEKLSNSDTKVFEVLIKIDGTDMNLRPSMTTNNKILIKSFDNVVFVPNECVHTGVDSIPFVYTKSGNKQVVVLGESNDKEVIIENGLTPHTPIYLEVPEKAESFNYSGIDLIKKGSK